MRSYYEVTEMEAAAYGRLKRTLNMQSDDDFLKYMRVKTINQFNQSNLLIGLNSFETTHQGLNSNNSVPGGRVLNANK